MANTKKVEMSEQAKALIDVLKANPNKEFTLTDLAKEANVAAKSGYLGRVKTELDNHLIVGEKEIEVTTKRKVKTYTYIDQGEDFSPSSAKHFPYRGAEVKQAQAETKNVPDADERRASKDSLVIFQE